MPVNQGVERNELDNPSRTLYHKDYRDFNALEPLYFDQILQVSRKVPGKLNNTPSLNRPLLQSLLIPMRD